MENKLLWDQKNISLSLNPNITDKFDTRKEDSICFIPSWKSQAYLLDKFEIWSWLVCNGETTPLFTTAKPCAVSVLLVERLKQPIGNPEQYSVIVKTRKWPIVIVVLINIYDLTRSPTFSSTENQY